MVFKLTFKELIFEIKEIHIVKNIINNVKESIKLDEKEYFEKLHKDFYSGRYYTEYTFEEYYDIIKYNGSLEKYDWDIQNFIWDFEHCWNI